MWHLLIVQAPPPLENKIIKTCVVQVTPGNIITGQLILISNKVLYLVFRFLITVRFKKKKNDANVLGLEGIFVISEKVS